MPATHWSELSSAALATRARDAASLALLPLGALEQHGPHLPLGTDGILAREMAWRAAQGAENAEALVLPEQSYTASAEHHDWPGTVWIEPEDLVGLLCAVGRGVAQAGLRKLVILNAHGGNQPAIQIAARRLRKDHGLMCVSAGWMVLGIGDHAPELRRGDIHGGFLETAAMLHLRPDLVDMGAAENFTPLSEKLAEENAHLRLMGAVNTGWVARDLHPSGAAGNAAAATATAGAEIVETATGAARAAAGRGGGLRSGLAGGRAMKLTAQLRAPAYVLNNIACLDEEGLQRRRIAVAQGHLVDPATLPEAPVIDAAGWSLLPRLVDAHVHLDKAFSLSQTGMGDGTLGGAMAVFAPAARRWSGPEIRARMARALNMAFAAGTGPCAAISTARTCPMTLWPGRWPQSCATAGRLG